MKDFSLFIKQCYCIIVWSVEKIQKVKIQNLKEQKMEEHSKKSKFVKEQEGSGLLSNLGTKKPLSKIPSAGHLLF